MKTIRLILCSAFVTGLISSPNNLYAADKPDVSTVENKVRANIAALTGKKDPIKARHKQSLQGVLAALTRLRLQLDSGNLDHLNTKTLNIHHQIPPHLQESIVKLEIEIKRYVDEVKKEDTHKRHQKIDELIAKTKKLCKSSAPVENIEAILVELVSLGSKNRNYNDPVARRYDEKYEGLLFTVQSWIRYHDFKKSGNPSQANNQLKQISTSSKYPVLGKKIIDTASMGISPEPHQLDISTAVFRDINGVNDIPKAQATVEHLLKTHSSNHSKRNQLKYLQQTLTKLERVRQNISNGDGDYAISTLRSAHPYSSTANAQFHDLICELEHLYLDKVKLSPDGMKPAEHESARLFLSRVFTKQVIASNFDAALKTATKLDLFSEREPLPPSYYADLKALQSFTKAQKFERVNDFLLALTHYRECVGITGTTNAPVKEATKAIGRIAEKHPDLMKKTDAALIERINQLERKLMSRDRSPYHRRR